MKKLIFVIAGLILFFFSCTKEDDKVQNKQDQESEIPSNVYWAVYSNFPKDTTYMVGSATVGGKLFVGYLDIGEPSTGELLEDLEFPTGINCVTTTSPKEKVQYWAERTQDEEGRTTSIKLASTAANIFYLNLKIFQKTDTFLPLLNIYTLKPDGEVVHAPDGAVLSDPYSDATLPIAGVKQLNFLTDYNNGLNIRSYVETAGYTAFNGQYKDGVYSFSTSKELDGRAKIEENVLRKENWIPVKSSTHGNVGVYEIATPKKMIGEVVATEYTHITRFRDGKKVYDLVSSSTSRSTMSYNIISTRLQTLQDIEMFNRVIAEDLRYWILTGITLEDANGEPTTIKSSGTTEEWSERADKLVLNEKSSFDAISDCYDWNISIEPYNTSVNEVPLAAIQQTYCVTSSSGNARLYTSGGKYKITGVTTGIRRNDMNEMENFTDNEPDTPIPAFYDRKPTLTENYRTEPLVINNTKELTEYLFNPKGIYTLVVNGKTLKEDESERNEYTATITITMWPEGTVADK